MRQPLAGIRVLDMGTRVAAPFCAGILGEQGAEVIKIEDPDRGDKTRLNGPFTVDDDGNAYSLYWSVEGRGRKSVTINLRSPEGQDLFRRLASVSDVVCENFRPGTLERWNIDPSQLDPRLVTARISLYGQQGPKSLLQRLRPQRCGVRRAYAPNRDSPTGPQRGRPFPFPTT